MTARTSTRSLAERSTSASSPSRKAERRRAAQRRAARRKLLLGAGIALVAGGLAFAFWPGQSGEDRRIDASAVRGIADTPFPASDGGRLTLAQYRGAPLVLYFYEGQACGACQTQLQELQAELPDLGAAGANVIAVTTDPIEVSTSVAQQLQLSYPIVEDVDHALGSAMGTFDPAGHMGPADQHSVVVLAADGTVSWRELATTSMYVAPADIRQAVQEA